MSEVPRLHIAVIALIALGIGVGVRVEVEAVDEVRQVSRGVGDFDRQLDQLVFCDGKQRRYRGNRRDHVVDRDWHNQRLCARTVIIDYLQGGQMLA